MKLLSQNVDKLEDILGSYNELQSLEKEGKIGMGSKDVMLEILNKNLKGLTSENKDFEKKVKKMLKERE